MAVDRVRYVGEAVAVVVADTKAQARDAAEAVEVTYAERPAVIIAAEAIKEGAPQLHPEADNNLIFDWEIGDAKATDAAIASAAHVTRLTIHNNRLVPNAMEPRGVVAHFEPGKGTMTIWSSTQNPHILRSFIAALTGLGQDQVRAIAPEVGGGFGAKINIYGEEYVAAVVSKKLGLPVKWIEDRSEAFVASTHGRDIICYLDIAARRDGRILGLKMRIIADIGAYNMLLTAAIPTLTALMANGTTPGAGVLSLTDV
jgi:carbon-monoxide dehydrogenase large subunit